MRAGGLVLAALVTALFVAACFAGREAGAPLPEGPPIVTVTFREGGFDYNPGTIPAGRVIFEVFNEDTEKHRLTLLPLPEDFPPLVEQLSGAERRVMFPFAGMPKVNPGGRGAFAVDLAPGQRYAMMDRSRGSDGQLNALKGYAHEFHAGGVATIPLASPTASQPAERGG